MAADPVDELARRLAARDRGAVSDALNLVDDRRPAMRDAALRLLDRVAGPGGDARVRRVGITGAPGAGKSTLLDALVQALRARDESVGIIAVDPSSRVSGGALLGDRFRMRSGVRDEGVFLRSMAARDRLGGLADATHAGVGILSASFDWVFVETVGVGQSEVEVAELVDSLVFVAQPGAGDTLQFMKAGILELPDVFVVNKADLGAPAERTASELTAGLGLSDARAGAWRPPVLLASAREGEGIDELVAALDAHRAHLEATGDLADARRRGRLRWLRETLERRYGSFGLEQIGGPKSLEARLDALRDESVFGLARDVGEEIEQALRAGG